MTSTRKSTGTRPERLVVATVVMAVTLAACTSSMASQPPRSTRATEVVHLVAQTDSRVTPTAVTGAAGYLWMLGTYPCSTGTCSVGVMRSSDGGKSFVRVGTLPAANYQIEFANREDGYAFGAGGGPLDESRLYWTGDGGKTWRFALARFRYSPPQVVVITDGRAYVLVVPENCSAKGPCKSVQLASSPVTSDTWTERRLPLTVSEAENQFGWTAFGSNVWLLLTWGVSSTRLLVSHDGGRTFSKLTPGGYLGGLGCALTATSPVTLWGFCVTGNGGYAIRATDGGREFVTLESPWGVSNGVQIYPASDSEAILYVLAGDVWLTRDSGKHFTTLLRIPHSSEYNCEVALASAKTWLVLGLSGYRPNPPYLMWRTTNGGRTWQSVKAPTVTATTTVSRAAPSRFVALAHKGLREPFEAAYRFVPPLHTWAGQLRNLFGLVSAARGFGPRGELRLRGTVRPGDSPFHPDRKW